MTESPDRRTPPRRRRRDRAAQPASPSAAAEPDAPKPARSRGTRGALAPADKSRLLRSGRITITLITVLALVITGGAWFNYNGFKNGIATLPGLADAKPDGALDILLVGTDSRTDAQGNTLTEKELGRLHAGVDEGSMNTDTIILIRIPNDGTSATAISIPRDSYVKIPGFGKDKINSAFGAAAFEKKENALEDGMSEKAATEASHQAGREKLVETVAQLTGVSVDHYAEIGLAGFALLTQAVGGVQVCLNNAVNDPYSGAHFKAGKQTLDGPQALSFVRQRHGLPRGDLDRIARQQAFMASLTHKILSAGTLTSPTKLTQLESAVQRSVRIDENWEIDEFAQQLTNLSAGKVKFSTIPVIRDDGRSDDGEQSVVVVDPKQVQAYVRALIGDAAPSTSKPTSTAPAVPSVDKGTFEVDVVNAGTVSGLASAVAESLSGKGYARGEVRNADASESARGKTTVLARSDSDKAAKAIAAELGGLPVVEDTDVPEGTVRVILREGYTGPGSSGDDAATSTTTSPGVNQYTEKLAPEEAARVSSILNRPGISAQQDDGVACVD